MAEFIDDNGDSFVDIDDFDSEEEGLILTAQTTTIPTLLSHYLILLWTLFWKKMRKQMDLFMVLSKKGDSLLGREYKLCIN